MVLLLEKVYWNNAHVNIIDSDATTEFGLVLVVLLLEKVYWNNATVGINDWDAPTDLGRVPVEPLCKKYIGIMHMSTL